MAAVEEILTAEGFSRIGKIRHDLEIGIWWNALAAIQVLVLELGSGEGEVLIRGSKGYFLLSMAEEAETWARDIAPFHDYLEAHFREVNLSFSFHRDVPQFLAEKKARLHRHRRPSEPSLPSLASLRERLVHSQRASRTMAQFSQLSSPADTELLHSHLAHRQRQQETESRDLIEQIAVAEQSEADEQHLIQQYRRKGSAASLTFSISSNLHVVASDDEFRVGVRSIVKELEDLDRFQVRQVLNGGRLRLQIAEVKEPALTWIEQWFGGMLNPNQLERVLSAQSEIAHSATKHVMVTPDEDIELRGGGVRMSVVCGVTSGSSRERWDGRIEALIRWLLHQWERERNSAQAHTSCAGRSTDAAEVKEAAENFGGNVAIDAEERGKGLDVHLNGAFVFNGPIAGPIGTDRGHMTS